jgi:hypothetical protein
VSGPCEKPFYLSRFSLLTKGQKKNNINYHHYYSTVPSGGPRAIDRLTYDANKSDARRT